MLHNPHYPTRLIAIPLEDFGLLQARYATMSLATRAQTVLVDAEPALQAAERILVSIADHAQINAVFDHLRNNHALVGKMRASEARQALADTSNDFIQVTRHKLASWRKTMERISLGEGIARNAASKEYIIGNEPIALAVAGISSLSSYLAIVQLAIGELAKRDTTNTGWAMNLAEIRRCATVLSDYEHASNLTTQVH